ncbi:MAG: tetratricopeptide repeat protein [Alphaproteobacteria bacterium]|nr:tetratricopeptide repeat protein [Alphaproteobacteria bacterium]
MKRSYLAIALTMSIFQINDVLSGKGDILLSAENSTCYHQPYQEVQSADIYYHKGQPQSYYDNSQNYVTVYVDGTYSVYFTHTNVLAIYYPNGAIRCDYVDGGFAIYDALSDLSQHFTDRGFLNIVVPGLPGGIPTFYPNPHYNNHSNTPRSYKQKPKVVHLKKSNKSYGNRGNKENMKNYGIGSQDQVGNTNPIVQSDALHDKSVQITNDLTFLETDNVQQVQSDDVKYSESIDEQIVPLVEQISLLKMVNDQPVEIAKPSQQTTWSSLFKGSSNVVSTFPLSDKKSNNSKKRRFSYIDLDKDAKDFLYQHNIKTLCEIKNEILKIKNNNNSFMENKFSYFINAANIFRHSTNIENKLLGKSILKYVLCNKRIDLYSKGRAYTYLGKIRSHDKQYEKAIQIFQKGLSVCGEHARLYYFIGNNYAFLERCDEAIENWNKAFDKVSKEDISLKIKIYHRFVHCKEYHKNNHKIIDKLLNENLLLIEDNYNVESFNEKNSKETKEIQRIYFAEIVNLTELYQNENLHDAALKIRSMFNQYGFMTSIIKEGLNYIKDNISDLVLEDIYFEKPIADHIEMSE